MFYWVNRYVGRNDVGKKIENIEKKFRKNTVYRKKDFMCWCVNKKCLWFVIIINFDTNK